MDYLLLIEQIELEDEYKSMLLTEGVVSSVIGAIKRGIAFIKEKICNLIRKIIGIFKKDKRSGGNSGGSGSSSTSNKNTVKVSTKVTNNTPKSNTSTPSDPVITNKDIKNDDVVVRSKVIDNTKQVPVPVKDTIKKRMVYSYKMFTDFLNCIIDFVNSEISDEISDFSFDNYKYTIDDIVDTIEQIAAIKNDQFNEKIQDLNTISFRQETIDSVNTAVRSMNEGRQIIKNISDSMLNIGPNAYMTPDEINEINNRIANEVGIDPDIIKRQPNLLYTQIMNKFNVYNLTDSIYNEILKYNKYAQDACARMQQGLSILEYKVTNNDTLLARQSLDYLKAMVDLYKQVGIMLISLANTILTFKSKSFDIAVINFK